MHALEHRTDDREGVDRAHTRVARVRKGGGQLAEIQQRAGVKMCRKAFFVLHDWEAMETLEQWAIMIYLSETMPKI